MKNLILAKNRHLKKHVAAIRISARIGLLERKMWNVLLLNAYEELSPGKGHQIKVSDLSELIGFNSRNVSHLESCLDNLQSAKVKWNIGGDDLKNLNRGSIPLLGGFRMEDGCIFYDYPPMLSEMLYKPEVYERINLYYQLSFKSSYGLALWENCLRFVSVGSTGFSPVEEWRQLLGATAASYSTYTNFSKIVLKPAIEEVNKVSNINIELKIKKEGRKIIEIGFDIEQKKDFELTSAIDQIRETKEYKELLENGLSKVQALKFMQEYEKEYINEKINFILDMKNQGKIKVSASGLLVSAIQHDWKNEKLVQAEIKKEEEKKKREEEAEERRKQELAKIEKEFLRSRKEKYLETLSKEERQELLESLREPHKDSALYAKIGSFDSPFISASLSPIVKALPGYKRELEAYIKDKSKEK